MVIEFSVTRAKINLNIEVSRNDRNVYRNSDGLLCTDNIERGRRIASALPSRSLRSDQIIAPPFSIKASPLVFCRVAGYLDYSSLENVTGLSKCASKKQKRLQIQTTKLPAVFLWPCE
ncbi:uncharacterized protein LOC119657212 [Hermetia illucens]|uniref:uncharacterized protein LOC119657212 n=1 Tax=Hermetia illucens TaxID=343691 RepID=UPI0018CC0D18|nr:uncharacterized protein LOC119657212 [Hermetia illucens]